MKKYKVTITEILKKTVEVDAEDYTEAVETVESAYFQEQIILTADDYSGSNFDAEEIPAQTEKTVKNRKDFSR